MYYQGAAVDAQILEKEFEVVYVIAQNVGIVTGLIGESTAEVVQGDDPVRSAQAGDEVAKIVRPGRIAMDHDHTRPMTFVEIVQSVLTDPEKMALEGIIVIHREFRRFQDWD
jgi:hypothetical protein